MMVAAKDAVFERCKPLLEAVGQKIYHVGTGDRHGATVKAAVQAFVCASYTSLFEALVLGVKAGVKPEILNEVFNASFVASPLTRNAIPLIMERKFDRFRRPDRGDAQGRRHLDGPRKGPGGSAIHGQRGL